MGLPKTEIIFRELADTAIARSSRGAVALLLDDATAADTLTTYGRASDIDATKWTADNAALIKLAFASGAAKVLAQRVTKAESVVTWATEIDALVPMKWSWLAAPSADAAGMAAIATKLKALRADGKTYKAVVANPTTPSDCEGVVDYAQTGTVTSDCMGTSKAMTAAQYTVRLAGLFAGLALDRSATGYELTDISALTVDSTPGTSIDAGKLVIVYSGETYEIARAVTSLTTTDETHPKLFKKIKHVEGCDMMAADLDEIWRKRYRGKKVNSYDSKQALVADCIAYLDGISGTVLSPDYDNTAYVDTDAQNAWLMSNGTDTTSMSDNEVAQANTEDQVFIKLDTQLIDAMEDVSMSIVLE